MKVMVVDDSKTARMFAIKVIKMASDLDIEIIEASSGENALEILFEREEKNEVVDLIFCDVNMPVMSGFTFMHNISIEPKLKLIPVVFVTSITNTGNINNLRKLGAKGVIPKPVKVDHIKQVLEGLGIEQAKTEEWGV